MIAIFIWGISPAMANNGEVKLCPFATGQKMPTNLLVGTWGKGLSIHPRKEAEMFVCLTTLSARNYGVAYLTQVASSMISRRKELRIKKI